MKDISTMYAYSVIFSACMGNEKIRGNVLLTGAHMLLS